MIDDSIKRQLSKRMDFFLKYFPVRVRNVGEDAVAARKLIWAFKDARHIEEDFLKSIHDAQFGICHATGTFAENIRSGKDDGRNEMAISATT